MQILSSAEKLWESVNEAVQMMALGNYETDACTVTFEHHNAVVLVGAETLAHPSVCPNFLFPVLGHNLTSVEQT